MFFTKYTQQKKTHKANDRPYEKYFPYLKVRLNGLNEYFEENVTTAYETKILIITRFTVSGIFIGHTRPAWAVFHYLTAITVNYSYKILNVGKIAKQMRGQIYILPNSNLRFRG